MSECVTPGKVVSISFLIKDDTDQVVDYSAEPVRYLQGGIHDIFPQIESALNGKKVGDEVTVELQAEDAFGFYDSDLTFTDELENTPSEVRHVGAKMSTKSGLDKAPAFRVIEIEDGKITFDANHILAGRQVTFIVTVMEVRAAKVDEIMDQRAS